jgi:hypothetical protein
LLPQIIRAGEWFLDSGIQEMNGGVARYHRTDTQRNLPVSTEITGYSLSALVYLRHFDRARSMANFLCDVWDDGDGAMPFELGEPGLAYFFDSGIIVRGLLAAWRSAGVQRYLDTAMAIGRHMLRDHVAAEDVNPILSLPTRLPIDRDPLSWSRSPGCYQLKSAMAWHDLAQTTGDASFAAGYERVLDYSLRTYTTFLPGHPDRLRVMDRLHAFSYFLEGMMPRAREPRCCAAINDGIGRVAGFLREIGPEFERSDVYAQLLRARVYADRAGVAPLDREAADWEAARLQTFQAEHGGFYFGRRNGEFLPFFNPVSTAFAAQALAVWSGEPATVAELI